MRADDADDRIAARLSALGVPEPAAPGASSGPTGARPARSLQAWLDQVAVAADGRAVLWLAAVCAACVAVTAWTLLHHRAAPAPIQPLHLAAPVRAEPTPTPSGLVVDVGGRVRRPGLVTLPPGARVADAIHAAGGAVRPGDLRLLNLAARVTDGQLLLVGVSGAPVAGPASPAAAGPVNLNSATVEELDTLPGIGPVLAQRIVDWRTAHGGFGSVSDLDEVSGIGDAIYAELSPLVTV
jgi:competence protein ComEA